jgi:hypothetical protein
MNSEERAGMPRWVKLSLLAGVLVAGLVVVVLLMSGAHKIPSHGPSGGDTSSSVHVPPTHGQ